MLGEELTVLELCPEKETGGTRQRAQFIIENINMILKLYQMLQHTDQHA